MSYEEDFDDPLNDLLEGRVEGDEFEVAAERARREQLDESLRQTARNGSQQQQKPRRGVERQPTGDNNRPKKGGGRQRGPYEDEDIRNFIEGDLGMDPFSDGDDEQDDDGNADGERGDEAMEVKDKKSKADPKEAKPVKPKRIVLRPQPKLNNARLAAANGLPKLVEEAGRLRGRLKGKGHELEDLDEVLQTMALWSHRLFPKLTFDDFIGRLEDLKAVKPLVLKIRHNMPLAGGDFVSDVVLQNDEDDDGDADPSRMNVDGLEALPRGNFDDLFGSSAAAAAATDGTQRSQLLSQLVADLDDEFGEDFEEEEPDQESNRIRTTAATAAADDDDDDHQKGHKENMRPPPSSAPQDDDDEEPVRNYDSDDDDDDEDMLPARRLPDMDEDNENLDDLIRMINE